MKNRKNYWELSIRKRRELKVFRYSVQQESFIDVDERAYVISFLLWDFTLSHIGKGVLKF